MALVLDIPKSDWPPGLTRAAISHCPLSLRPDAIQAAWLAHAEGRKPDSAVRALLRHEVRHKTKSFDFELCPTRKVRRRF
jgi:predicted HD phosphohydrolase